jgi:PTH1 family peptidyl-tRNA hydrolase
MSEIKLIVGLGNPGREYEDTRHNAGFWWVDEFARAHQIGFKAESRFHAQLARGVAHGHEVLVLKPQTFMNVSGRAVGALAQFYKVAPQHILVVHDEIDLPPGTARLKLGGGHGGHNGLKDIIAHLGSRDFWRLRIGIGHPGDRDEVVNYVLKPARAEEQTEIDRSLTRALELWPLIARGEWERAIQRANTRPAPPAPPASNRPESQP